ncbi:hypothetical protein NM688_g1892 [Phlebia brevispora]|uniref:Uncharacterized protein n=1 Tax=Phlebia brevispora TaxID=194682 RepID=A0ACC1TA83_9APHY|nr:hypothetical protein NM688_g1892 [Phlebia brevispora]
MATDIKTRVRELQSNIRVEIPDLYALLPGWRFTVNMYYDRLKTKVDDSTAILQLDDAKMQAILSQNLDQIGACFYPDANEEEHFVGALYHIGIFVWDDQLDCGDLKADVSQAEQLRNETVACLVYALGNKLSQGSRPSFNPIVSYLCDAFEKIGASTNEDARIHILGTTLNYVHAACALPMQRTEKLDRLLSEAEFMEQRKISGGTAVSIALLLYIYHLDIPLSILQHEAMQVITEQSCLIVHLANDVVSFVRELRLGQVDSFVVILALQHDISLQQAVGRACALIVAAREQFEQAATRLPLPTGNQKLDEDIRKYVQGCRDVASGSIHWSYLTERYFGKNPERDVWTTNTVYG